MMFGESRLRELLPVGSLGAPFVFFPTIGSTNDLAKQKAEAGAPHGTLLIAEEQTAGRGRGDNRWSTPAGSALAFSLILRPGALPTGGPLALNVLGALAVSEAIESLGGEPQIKWPNDVLMAGKKVAGVLVEAAWREDKLEYTVIGIGVNVLPAAVPPDEQVSFPAASVEGLLSRKVDRVELLVAILRSLDHWLERLTMPALVTAWGRRLAYLGQAVVLESDAGSEQGILQGVTASGQLRLQAADGREWVAGDEFRGMRAVDYDPG
jgi:BirA family biotin operon repressor/biotin-[acetyl-CoA-carboxylase] ligase